MIDPDVLMHLFVFYPDMFVWAWDKAAGIAFVEEGLTKASLLSRGQGHATHAGEDDVFVWCFYGLLVLEGPLHVGG